MAIEYSDYDSGKIDNLLQVIRSAWENGQKQEYEIFVDKLKVVHRTGDPEAFARHSDFVNEDSKSLVIVLFKGGSRNNDKYFFQLKGFKKEEPQLLGLPENVTLAEHDERQKAAFLKDLRLDELEKQNAELKVSVADKDKTIEQLSNRLQELHEGKLITIGDMGSAVVMRLLEHPTLRQVFPVLNGLSGINTQQQKTQPTEEATFSRKGEKTEEKAEENLEGIELTEEEQRYLQLIHDLQEKLTHLQLASVMHILDILTQFPQAIGSTLKHLNDLLDSKNEKK